MENVVHTTKSGIKVKRKTIDRDDYVESRFFVEGPGVLPIRLRGKNREYKGKLLAETIERIGGIDPRARKKVPVEIINEGKPAIVAYLHTVHNMPVGEIARRLSIEPEAVKVYFSQFLNGER